MTDTDIPTAEAGTATAERWLIVATDFGYQVGQVVKDLGDGVVHMDMGPEATFPMAIAHPSCFVAEHADEKSARAGLARAKSVEAQYRPFWQIAVRAEQEARTLMIEAGRAAAQPASAVN